jgi:hypothetical protein
MTYNTLQICFVKNCNKRATRCKQFKFYCRRHFILYVIVHDKKIKYLKTIKIMKKNKIIG